MVIFSKSMACDKVPEESTFISEIPKYPYNTVWDRLKEAFDRTPLICNRLTDGQADEYRTTANTARGISNKTSDAAVNREDLQSRLMSF